MSSKVDFDFEHLDEVVKKLPFPLQIMSMHNAAMDIIAITSNAKKKDGEARWYMMGESYGADLANTAYRIARDLFAGAILDGFSPLVLSKSPESDIRHHLADNCTKPRMQHVDSSRKSCAFG